MLICLLLLIGGGTCVYLYPYVIISYLWNIYMKYKYYNYKVENLPEKKYILSKVIIISHNRKHTIPLSINLRQSQYTITYDLLRSLCCEQNIEYCCLVYEYGDSTYAYPCVVNDQLKVTFPVYDTEDLDTCMTTEWELKEDLMINPKLLTEYSGPKGNFYTDIRSDYAGKLLGIGLYDPILKNDNDNITLYNMFDHQLTIEYNTQIGRESIN